METETNEQTATPAEVAELKAQVLKLTAENTALTNRAMKVFSENTQIKASPDIAAQVAKMDMQLAMAEKFCRSKAFSPSYSPEQIYVIIQAGDEMGIPPVQALQSLYCVNGTVKFYGDKMLARLTGMGYRVQYVNEKPGEIVTVRVTGPDGTVYEETAKSTDQVLQRSKAMGFAAVNKLRFHAIRMIASFHLPHLFGSVQDEFTREYHEWEEVQPKGRREKAEEKERQRITRHIEQAQSLEELTMVRGLVSQYNLAQEYAEREEQLLGHD